MSGEAASPTKIVKEWWGIVLVVVGLIGGFTWLETKYAKIAALNDRSDHLQREIEELECKLKYTIDERDTLIELRGWDELLEAKRTDLAALDEIERTAPRAAEIRVEIETAETRVLDLDTRRVCLAASRDRCSTGERYASDACR